MSKTLLQIALEDRSSESAPEPCDDALAQEVELAVAYFKDQIFGCNVAKAVGIKSSAVGGWCSGKLMKGIRRKLVIICIAPTPAGEPTA